MTSIVGTLVIGFGIFWFICHVVGSFNDNRHRKRYVKDLRAARRDSEDPNKTAAERANARDWVDYLNDQEAHRNDLYPRWEE